jgi:hypothetical protein
VSTGLVVSGIPFDPETASQARGILGCVHRLPQYYGTGVVRVPYECGPQNANLRGRIRDLFMGQLGPRFKMRFCETMVTSCWQRESDIIDGLVTGKSGAIVLVHHRDKGVFSLRLKQVQAEAWSRAIRATPTRSSRA